MLESETCVKNPGGIYRNGRLGKKGKKKNEIIGKGKVDKQITNVKYKCFLKYWSNCFMY